VVSNKYFQIVQFLELELTVNQYKGFNVQFKHLLQVFCVLMLTLERKELTGMDVVRRSTNL